jgi:site-specific DNA recombinase
MRAAVYLRVSSEEQRERQTILTQKEEIARYCEAHGVTVIRTYADDGVSGTIPFAERPEGARLIRDAAEGRFDTVLIYKIDRLGRDPLVTLLAVEALKALGVSVQSTTQGFDPEDPVGRLLMTILSGVAGFERETLIQRSIAGTNRLARQGVWLGGIVPYGYRVEGRDKDARLVVSEEPVPGTHLTEAGVIRLIYRLAVEERLSCYKIAERLNTFGVPPAYSRDGRSVSRGKRKVATAGIWRPSRIRNLLASSTYRGIHQYGRRTKRDREVIERQVPAIVDEETWAHAQGVLKENQLMSPRSAKRQYLLRGLMKCGLCGLTYSGTVQPNGTVYYRCNGQIAGRGPYALKGERCPSTSLSGAVEALIWDDIEDFLRNPDDVLAEVRERFTEQSTQEVNLHAELATVTAVLVAKQGERDAVLGLYRRGRIDDSALDRQLDEIDQEEARLEEERQSLEARMQNAGEVAERLKDLADLLAELRGELDSPLTWEKKRALVEKLVGPVRVDTVEEDGRKEAVVTATYHFCVTVNCTDRGSSPRPASPAPGRRGWPAPG